MKGKEHWLHVKKKELYSISETNDLLTVDELEKNRVREDRKEQFNKRDNFGKNWGESVWI